MRKLALTKDSVDFLDRLDAKQFRQVWRKTLSLLINPTPNDSKAIKGQAGYFRADIGEFRIVYLFSADEVSIDRIGKRNDDEVYK